MSEQGTRYELLMIREYIGRDGQKQSHWTKIGVAFANRDGQSFSLKFEAFPTGPDPQIQMRLPRPKEWSGGFGNNNFGRSNRAGSYGAPRKKSEPKPMQQSIPQYPKDYPDAFDMPDDEGGGGGNEPSGGGFADEG